MASLQAAKKELRGQIKKILSGLSKESINKQSSTVTKLLLSLPEYQAAKRLSVYLAMPSGEIQTADIVRDAFSKGKRVYVPYIYQLDPSAAQERKSVMEMLALRSIDDYESLQPDKWGIPSLDADTLATRENCFGGFGLLGPSTASIEKNNAGLDLIVMPGLAFDESFGRLGHGKGYYDHFVMKCRGQQGDSTSAIRKPYLVALTLKEQILPPSAHVPAAEYDIPVDALIVGDGRILQRK
ncbi:5-formyltetrahydrofolate cyclo-ligase family protein [Emydomyces testavorans]|uniref:5-formyltetrahydrofolate cyclo-ligase n=1 Tax=Emydomyces testavorans TaxID=2070801 RepID=A0AAF0IJP7_9EURO|nr:5-formyltetrahydrofolate cyclo-ligase family protein [Emydomyces testavorans]